MNLKKNNLFLFFTLALICHFIQAEDYRFRISILLGINHVFQYGSADDYVMGENNFPVTPSHSTFGIGGGIAYFLNNRLGLELDGRYFQDTQMILEDPVDLDRVTVDSAKHYSLSLNGVFRLSRKGIMPYVVAGCGIDQILTEDKTVTSSYGYEIKFPKPEKTIDPLIQGGGGVEFHLDPNIRLKVDLRNVFIFTDGGVITSLNVMAGIFLAF